MGSSDGIASADADESGPSDQSVAEVSVLSKYSDSDTINSQPPSLLNFLCSPTHSQQARKQYNP